jgi:hypothetical protein
MRSSGDRLACIFANRNFSLVRHIRTIAGQFEHIESRPRREVYVWCIYERLPRDLVLRNSAVVPDVELGSSSRGSAV